MTGMSDHRLVYVGKWTFTVSKQFILNPNISPGAKCVFLAIKSFCASPDSISAFPSSRLLADALHINRTTVFKYVDELKSIGLMKTEQVQKDGKFAHTVYYLFDEGDQPCAKKPDAVKPDAVPSSVRATDTVQESPATKPAGAGGLRERSPKQKEAWRIKQLADGVKAGWLAAHKAQWPGEAYQLTGADVGQLRLFVRNTTLTAHQIVQVAVAAWAFKAPAGFSHARNLKSLCYLLSKFNEIKSEISNENSSNSNRGGNVGTLNQGKFGPGQYAGVGKMVRP